MDSSAELALQAKGYRLINGEWWPPKEKVLDSNRTEPKLARRIRQDHRPLMNKLEESFLGELLLRGQRKEDILIQAIRFRLANGLWYKPDFVVWPCAWEVKGPHAWRGGYENLKMAAATYPHISWVLVWKEHGRWCEQKILP